MRIIRPLSAVAAAALLTLSIGTAHAAPVAASGRAVSGLTVTSLTAAGHSVTAASTRSLADTIGSRLAEVRFTPMNVDGTDILPAVTVTPEESPRHVEPAVAQPAPGVSVVGPSGSLFATLTDLLATAGLRAPEAGRALGSVNVLGAPVAITGLIENTSTVTNDSARATKAVSFDGITLPSINALLASLGIDLAKLPVANLNALLDQLGLDAAVQTALNSANAAIDSAQAALGTLSAQLAAAQAALDSAQTTLAGRQSDLAAANSAVTAAQSALTAALTAAGLPNRAAFEALPPAAQATYPAVVAAIAALDSATTTQTAAQTAVTTAQTAVDTAQSAVDAAQAAVLAASGPLLAAYDDLVGIVRGALDIPLASIGAMKIGTLAEVGTTKTARVVGSISGITVAGTDILAKLGMSSLDLASATDGTIAAVQSAVDTVMATFSTGTGALQGITGLNIPTPQIDFLDKKTSTGTDQGFGTASVDVTALRIAIPAISLPKSIALPSALAGTLTGVVPGANANMLGVQPTTLVLGSMTERARFRPSSTSSAPNTSNTPGAPMLPRTGGPVELAFAALFVTGLGLRALRVARRNALVS